MTEKEYLMMIRWVVVAETMIVVLFTLLIPTSKSNHHFKSQLVHLVSILLEPFLFIIPFSVYHSLRDIYFWKPQWQLYHCVYDPCRVDEKIYIQKLRYEAQINFILCSTACLLYWCIYRVCNYYKYIQKCYEVEKRCKKL